MATRQGPSGEDGYAGLDRSDAAVLSPAAERALLEELGACKEKLAQALASIEGVEVPAGADDPQALARYISSSYAVDGPNGARLGAIYRKYSGHGSNPGNTF